MFSRPAVVVEVDVAIIGTGATAIQCIPHLGASAEHLYVFQPTPSSVDVRANRELEPEWAAALDPGGNSGGWTTSTPSSAAGTRTTTSSPTDGPTSPQAHRHRRQAGQPRDRPAPVVGREGDLMGLADFQKMESVRSRVDSVVEDPETAEKLKPWYRQFCKRPCFHDGYLPTYHRANVTLVDTDGQGVEWLTEHGVVVDGVGYEVDRLIFAIGFEVGMTYTGGPAPTSSVATGSRCRRSGRRACGPSMGCGAGAD